MKKALGSMFEPVEFDPNLSSIVRSALMPLKAKVKTSEEARFGDERSEISNTEPVHSSSSERDKLTKNSDLMALTFHPIDQ